jgi:hypothetical protein
MRHGIRNYTVVAHGKKENNMAGKRSKRSDVSSPRIARLGAQLERSLATYAVAATAAGVGLLALSPCANAKIIYTPANQSIGCGASIPVDLNQDGVVDFSAKLLCWSGGDFVREYLHAGAQVQGNLIRGKGTASLSLFGYLDAFASALRPGFTVGPDKLRFLKGNGLLAEVAGGTSGTATAGQWMFTLHRYLGLSFLIEGQIHYGWARFKVGQNLKNPIEAVLTGYAYETIPNKPIITGKTKGPDVITLEPAILGRLAQGASGMSVWRGKK